MLSLLLVIFVLVGATKAAFVTAAILMFLWVVRFTAVVIEALGK